MEFAVDYEKSGGGRRCFEPGYVGFGGEFDGTVFDFGHFFFFFIIIIFH